jgi:hypothetical protein
MGAENNASDHRRLEKVGLIEKYLNKVSNKTV